ncbi:MAG: cytochrome b5-like heme/steroid binding domain-containing protein [Minisyncoccia bacterium]
MQNKFIPALIGIFIIVAVGGLVHFQTKEKAPFDPVVEGKGAPRAQKGSYTLADVSTHATASDCWSVINGGVYDLTSWVPRHPGGKRAIESICGKDGSAAFNGQHAGGEAQAALLVSMKIGDLK